MAICESAVKDYLAQGKTFPPRTEYERLNNNIVWQNVLDGKFENIFPSLKSKLYVSLINQNGEIENFLDMVVPKYPSLIEKKFAELAFGKKPVVVHDKKGDLDIKINKVLSKTDFWNTIKRAFIDSRVFGNGIIDEYNTLSNIDEKTNSIRTDLEPEVSNIDVNLWCPVVSDTNRNRVVGHLIGSVYGLPDDNGETIKEYRIRIVYSKNNTCDEYLFKCSEPFVNTVNLLELLEYRENVGLANKFNRIKTVVGFNTTSTYPYGISAFNDYYSVVAQLINRLTQFANILDKHATPIMTGPKSVLDYNEDTGEWTFNRSAFVGVSPEDAGVKLEYVTWDAKLDSCLDDINKLTKIIYQMSETGANFLDDIETSEGFAPSAKALRIRQKSPISVVNTWITENENTIKRAIADVCYMSGIEVDWTELEMNWKPNLPEDELEQSQIFLNKYNAGFSFVDEAMRSYGMTYNGAMQEFEDRNEENKTRGDINGEKQITVNASANNTQDYMKNNPDTQRKQNDQI